MAQAGPAGGNDGASPAQAGGRSNLFLRVVSALVLAPVALGTAWLGGWPFALLWGAAAIAVLWEWFEIVAGGRAGVVAGGLCVAACTVLLGFGLTGWAIGVVLLGAVLAAALAEPDRRAWGAGGVLYAGALVASLVVLRRDTQYGFLAVIFLFAVVWATDIAAYFAGRAIGGPKLCPAISPKKTWSGALGGTAAAVLAAVAVARFGGLAGTAAIVLVAVVLSAISQAGDLVESAVKRRFGVKDASHLIPGHGGLMDRLDGFLAAAAAAAIFGALRGDVDASARSLLVW